MPHAPTLAAIVALGVAGCASTGPHLARATSTVYVRSDTDATTIVAPAIAATGQAGDVTVEAGYTIDAWTGASVDVVTAATPAIRELRHELRTGLGYAGRDLRLAARYRYSLEPDYWSHGVVLGVERDLARRNTTLGLELLASRDTVGRAGDAVFRAPLKSLGFRAAFTQVLGRATIAQLAWELTALDGYQASPYRFVAIGGDGACATGAPYCIPEHVPDERLRSALLGRARRALTGHLSAGLGYRLYFDSWGVWSHAVEPDVAWRVTDDDSVVLRARYYTQGEARFYRVRYRDFMSSDGYATRDRKLSALLSGELGAEYSHRFALDDGDTVVTVGARGALIGYDYRAYVGLGSVWAAELTALFAIERP